MRTALRILASAGILAGLAWPAMADDTKLTIATVNNGDMIRMQSLTDDFKAKNPGIDRASGSRWRRTCSASG